MISSVPSVLMGFIGSAPTSTPSKIPSSSLSASFGLVPAFVSSPSLKPSSSESGSLAFVPKTSSSAFVKPSLSGSASGPSVLSVSR